MNKVLFVSSEAYPLIKTGGLADVAGSLPRALQKRKQDVRLLLPGYRSVLAQIKQPQVVAETFHYGQKIRIIETCLPDSRVKVWLVDCPVAFDRTGNPYVGADGHDWPDNAFRFALFCQVAVDIALNRCNINWQADIVHCNDWQTALVPALLDCFSQRPATVFTIHNMAYQGIFDQQTFFDLGLPVELWHPEGVEFYNQFSFLKGGLAYADYINTVSPTYAGEIQQAEFGYGLDGLLRHRSERLNGILNGIDNDVWNPGKDLHIQYRYNQRTIKNKSLNKTELQTALKLPVDATIPMIGMISRMVEQKGFDTVIGALHELVKWPIQLVLLGNGQSYYQNTLIEWAKHYPKKIHVRIGYDETLSHRIEAAADLYLMPSLFEPCGLNQLYSLRYGTLPVVRNVGGLADSVCDTTEASIADNSATGFIITDNKPATLISTLQRALDYYLHPAIWRQLQVNAMSQDFSWQQSAEAYLSLYQQALENNPKRGVQVPVIS
jgi:starch synthase